MGREPSVGVMRGLEVRTEALATTFDAQSVANTLWAYATMGREPSAGVMRGLEVRAEALAPTFTEQDVANTLWARCVLATMTEVSNSLVYVLSCRLLSLGKASCLNDVQLSQLHQSFLSCSMEEKLCEEAFHAMPADLKDVCHSAFVHGSVTTLSVTQQQVSETLQKMGLSVEDEVRCPKSGYTIDMLVHSASAMEVAGIGTGGTWAVEFDGPSHFLACSREVGEGEGQLGRSPTGATLLKRRHLQLLGYALVSVPYWEWDACKGAGKREQYLWLKLGECGPARGANIVTCDM